MAELSEDGGKVGRCRKMSEDVGKCRKMSENVGNVSEKSQKCRGEVWGDLYELLIFLVYTGQLKENVILRAVSIFSCYVE